MEDDERLLEHERYQIEQIRQLDFEELQVEEVDGDDDDSVEDNRPSTFSGSGAPGPSEFTFDTSLATLHTYLGDVEDTHHRLAFLEGGAVLNMPILFIEGVVLFPEATLPLRVIQPNFIAAVERALSQDDAPCTIGVVRAARDHIAGFRFATTGTTAEIRQYRRLEDGSMNVVTRGQQRFRVRRFWFDEEGAPYGEIQIIQEDLPLRTPREVVGKLDLRNLRTGNALYAPRRNDSRAKQLSCEDGNDSDVMSDESFESELSLSERRLHQSALAASCGYDDESTSSDEEKSGMQESELGAGSHLFGKVTSIINKRREDTKPASAERPKKRLGSGSIAHLREVPRAFWPGWVYRIYDSYYLAQRAADRWKQIVKAPSLDGFVMKPDLLSFHIASKIPVSESSRQELLEIDGTTNRLRKEIELLENFDRIRCKTCQKYIARRSDMLVMSSDGPLGAYVNPHGYVHEVMTLHEADGLMLSGRLIKEYSWFPGYGWIIAECSTCSSSMGWLFMSLRSNLKPQKFWGIRISQVADDMS